MLESRKKVDIPLKQIANNQRGNIAAQARAVCENEYATRYLESIGVNATKDQRDVVLSNLPLEKALVVPVWTSGALSIVPDRCDEKDPYTIKQLVSGSKEIDYSSKSQIDHFYGKGVSAPGSKRPVLGGTGRDKSIPIFAQDLYNQRSSTPNTLSRDDMSPSIHVTFPCDGYIPGQEASSKLFKKMIKPLAVSDVRLKMAVKSFSMSLANFVPQIFDDTTGLLNVSIQKFISTPTCRRLYGLLCHHIYWNLVHPFAHKVMMACRKQFPQMLFAHQHSSLGYGNSSQAASVAASRRNSMLSIASTSFHTSDIDDEMPHEEELKRFDSRGVSSDCDEFDHFRIPFAIMSTDEGDRMDAISRPPQDAVSLGSVNGMTNAYSVPGSMTSNVSLSNEEKELLYVQLEDCISQMHAVMGYQQSALKCCRQTLVSACHYIVHDIICTHYSWLDEKSDGKTQTTATNDKVEKRDKKSKRVVVKDRAQQKQVELPPLSTTDKKNIKAMKRGVLKCVNVTLTELLDPARVFASRISKEMFNGEDITLREVTVNSNPNNPDKIAHGQLSRVRESKDAHRKGKFTSTSLAVQAIFSSTCCAETRRFLLANGGKDDRALALARLGRGVTRRPHSSDGMSLTGSSLEGDSSQSNGGCSFDTSLEFSLAVGERTRGNKKPLQQQIIPGTNKAQVHAAGTVGEFKVLLAQTGIDPSKRSKLGFTNVASESKPKFVSELILSTKNFTDPSPERLEAHRTIASRLNPMEMKRNEAGNYLSTDARARLMSLVVGRSKSKYKQETILQNSRHPNAKFRKDLLSTGGNNTRLL